MMTSGTSEIGPLLYDWNIEPSLSFGTTFKFTKALNILRAIRALALQTADEDLTAYALELQAGLLAWSKLLPKPKENGKDQDEEPRQGYM